MASRKILLLNAYESGICGVIAWEKAVLLMLRGRANRPIGHEDIYEIRVSSGTFCLPTVLVLVDYVHIPRKTVACNKINVLKRDNFTCQYCGCKLNDSTGTVDHVFPESRGGKNNWKNVVAACRHCNGKKSNLTLSEAHRKFNMTLTKKPRMPKRDTMTALGLNERLCEKWCRWINKYNTGGRCAQGCKESSRFCQ